MQSTLSQQTELFSNDFYDTSEILGQITPLILTYNEETNIARTLEQLTWARRIVVVDSFSTDKTLEILQACPQVEIFQHKFKSFASQCNYGLSKIDSDWVLSLDADYVLSDALIREISDLSANAQVGGYTVRFKYCVFGKPLRGALLPPRKVLYRPELATYEEDGHAHRVCIKGDVEALQSAIYHDDRKSLSRWLWAQDRYMLIEAPKIHHTAHRELSWGDRIRKQKVLAPFVVFAYCLVLKGGLWDGWQGWYYALQRMFAEILLSIRLIEMAIFAEPTPKLNPYAKRLGA